MQNMHDRLMEKGGSYAKWHRHPNHQHFQWLFLVGVVVLIGYGLVQRMQDPTTLGLFSSAKNDKSQVSKGGLVGRAKDYILVKFLPGVSETAAQAKLTKRGSSQLDEITQIKVKKVKVPNGMEPEDFVQDLIETEPGIEFAEVDAFVEPSLVPDDFYYPSSWYLQNIKTAEAWDITTGSSSVIIAIGDTGVYCAHEDLGGKCVTGTNTYGGSGTDDVYGHGTKVAGTAAAVGNNTVGVSGVCWSCKIMPIKIAGDNGTTDYYAVANAITYAADHGARVINISYMMSESSSASSASQYMQQKKGVVVMSAGNYATNVTSADNPYILTIGGSTSGDLLESYSNYGSLVDFVAPGAVYTTANGGGYTSAQGTSFSAPLTAGAVGLIFSLNPSLTGVQVQNILKANTDDIGDPGYDPIYSWGRLNVYKALLAAGGTSTPPPDTQAPSVPTGLNANLVNGNTVNLSWQPSVDNVGVMGYKVFRNGTQIDSTASTFFTDGTAAINTTYSYTVRAFDAAGNVSGDSLAVSITTGQPSPTVSVTSFSVTGITANSATINWTTNIASTGTVNYGTNSSNLSGAATDNTLSTSHSVTLTGLSKNANYYFKISALASGAPTAYSGLGKFRTLRK